MVPGLSCKKSRGDTVCLGAKTFPVPHKGVCSCASGVCNNGQCQQDNSASSSGFGQLYSQADSNEQIEPEDFTVPLTLLSLAAISMLAGAVVLTMRIRRAWQAPVGRQLIASGDEDLLAASKSEECVE